MGQIIQSYKDVALDTSKKYFLLAGKAFDSGIFDSLFSNISYYRITDIHSNPDDVYVKELVEIFKKEACDAIIAIGGGSAIDTAKAIKYYLKNEALELIVAPTTAGTGSESTQFAVIYINQKKHSLDAPYLLPNEVILHEEVLKNLPMYQKKATMLDAFVQCIESIWAKKATKESTSYALKGLELFKQNYKAYMEDDTSTYMPMLTFANYSGKAINISRTTLAHAMSYELTIYGHVPHGYAVAMLLPYALRMLEEQNHPSITTIKEVLGCNTSLEEYYRNLLDELELPTFDLHEVSIDDLVDSVNVDRMENYPLTVSKDTIREIYKAVIQ